MTAPAKPAEKTSAVIPANRKLADLQARVMNDTFLDKIANVPTSAGDRPTTPVVIESIFLK